MRKPPRGKLLLWLYYFFLSYSFCSLSQHWRYTPLSLACSYLLVYFVERPFRFRHVSISWDRRIERWIETLDVATKIDAGTREEKVGIIRSVPMFWKLPGGRDGRFLRPDMILDQCFDPGVVEWITLTCL